jgi:hypothetical protein
MLLKVVSEVALAAPAAVPDHHVGCRTCSTLVPTGVQRRRRWTMDDIGKNVLVKVTIGGGWVGDVREMDSVKRVPVGMCVQRW